MEIAANQQDQNAINQAESQSFQKQAGYQQQASNALAQNLAKQGEPVARQEMGTGAASREALTGVLSDAAQPATGTPTTSSTDAATKAAVSRTGTAGNAWSSLASTAKAREGSYGDWGTALGIGNQNTNEQLGVQENLARGTANLLPLQVQAASHRADPLSGWGQIISALGNLAALGGATGAFGATGAAAQPAGALANTPLGLEQTPSIWGSILNYTNP